MIRVWIWDDIEPWAQIYTLCSSIVTSFLFLKLICHKWKRPDQPNVCVYVTCHVSSSTCLWHAKHLYACSICISVTCKGICKFYQACGTTASRERSNSNNNGGGGSSSGAGGHNSRSKPSSVRTVNSVKRTSSNQVVSYKIRWPF